jgi:hypothetical protein
MEITAGASFEQVYDVLPERCILSIYLYSGESVGRT